MILTKTLWLKTITMIEVAIVLSMIFLIGFLCGTSFGAMIAVTRSSNILNRDTVPEEQREHEFPKQKTFAEKNVHNNAEYCRNWTTLRIKGHLPEQIWLGKGPDSRRFHLQGCPALANANAITSRTACKLCFGEH